MTTVDAAILAVDPGNVSGMSFVVFDAAGKMHRFTLEVAYPEVGNSLRIWKQDHLPGWHGPVHLAVEKFVMSPGKGAMTAQPYALMTMGILEDHARLYGWKLHYYSVVTCKKVTNEQVRKAGMWQPTKDGHANDAHRVLLTHLKAEFTQAYADLVGL